MDYTSIEVTESGPIRTITLNRPERRNAMTPEMQMELIVALEETAQSDFRVLVLAGAGEAFCAGLDLSALQAMQDKSAAEHRVDAERIARLFLALYEMPVPTIAAVHGAAIGGGAGLATICDFTLATPATKFGFTEARIGFVPALVSAFLALQIGDKQSRDLLLTGRIVDAAEAHRIGLVNEVVAAENVQGQLVQALLHLAGEGRQERIRDDARTDLHGGRADVHVRHEVGHHYRRHQTGECRPDDPGAIAPQNVDIVFDVGGTP